jgi:DNA sulfur modification protein DndB
VLEVAQTKIKTDADAGIGRPRMGMFEYVFPAIRGVQAGREYYVTMCPLRLIPRLFVFDEEELPPEMRAQRSLNKARVPEMARYVVENPQSYVFSALTASIDAAVRFESFDVDGGPAERVGTLTIPMSAKFVINDGQHRRAAIQQALADSPELGDESIAIVMFLDIGLDRCQQMFADLNRYAIRPSKSIGVLYDHRDEISAITKLVVLRSTFFSDLTEMETSNLAARSRKLFTLSALYNANKALLDGVEPASLERRVDLATQYWQLAAEQFPEWRQVHNREVSAGEIRRDFIHSHGIVLHALGKIGNSLVLTKQDPLSWERKLRKLRTIDWHRSNAAAWEGRAILGGKVSKSAANVLLTTAAIRTTLGLPLPPEEQRAEDAFNRGEK